MKAILVINDMPSKCEECPCSSVDYETDGQMMFTCDSIPYGYLELSEENMTDKKPSWCPLKPMPEKKELKGGWYHPADAWMEGANYGWNACLDALGETE